MKAKMYVRSLKLSDGREILKSNQETAFLGFSFCTWSFQILHENLIVSHGSTLKVVMTYNLSKNHIETVFGKVRHMRGSKNNPTVRLFSAAFKKLFVHNDTLDINYANCLPLKFVPMPNVSS